MNVIGGFVVALSIALGAGCIDEGARDPVGATTGAIVGGVPDPGGLSDPSPEAAAARPTVGFKPRGADPAVDFFCSGTLIFPNVVLTAGHCAGQFDDRTIFAHTNGEFVAIDGCSVHPNIQRATRTTTCEEAPDRTSAIDVQFDLAVVRLSTPMSASIQPRSIAPPRSALAPAQFSEIVIRGFSGAGTPSGRRKLTTTASVGRDRGRGGTELLNITADPMLTARPGDSGGTITELSRDLAGGPVLAAVSRVSPEEDAAAPLLWRRATDTDPAGVVLPIDWLWGFLDPAGDCGLGAAPGGCRIFGEGPALADRDGDGLPDVRDLCPDHRPGDFDGDGVPEAPPETCGTNHCDADGDWVGDECDACGAGSDHLDVDGDGVADACDNCARENPSQANCNLDAEAITLEADGLPSYDPDNGKFGVGDACDPVPCGDTMFSVTSSRFGDLRVHALSGIDVEGVRESSIAQDNLNGFRHCRCTEMGVPDTVATRLACRAVVGCSIGDAARYDELRIDPSLEVALEPWRLFTVLHPRSVRTAGDDPRTWEVVLPHDHPTDGVFSPDTESTWDRFEDQQRWQMLGFGDAPPFGATPGVFWTHTPRTAAGTDNDDALAHHYTSLVVPEERTLDPGLLRSIIRGTTPRIELSPDRAIIPPGFARDAFPGAFFGAGPSGEPVLAQLDAAEPAGAHFDESAARLFRERPDAVWVPAAEPTPWLPPAGIRYGVLTADAADLLTTLIATDKGFSVPPDPLPPPTDGPVFAAAGAASGATPFATTLSARQERLWVARADGGLALWELELRTNTWSAMPVVGIGAITAVHAVTYSPFHDALWLVASGSDSVGLFRLTVVSTSTGRTAFAEPAFTFVPPASHARAAGHARSLRPTMPPTTRIFGIQASSVGEIFVVTSETERRGGYCALRFAREDRGLSSPQMLRGAGRLALTSIRVSERGLSLAVETSRAPLQPVGHRREEFRRRGDLAPCF